MSPICDLGLQPSVPAVGATGPGGRRGRGRTALVAGSAARCAGERSVADSGDAPMPIHDTARHPESGQVAERRTGAEPAPAGRPVLECVGLVRRFGDRVAVDDVGFAVAPGETYGLLGPNGAGKTTTIRMACGLLEPDAGTVVVAGSPMRTGPGEAKAFVGYAPQEIALYP